MAGLKAGYGFNTFPLMGNDWIPVAVWMEDTITQNILNNPFMIQFIHRSIAYVLIIISLYILYHAQKDRTLPARSQLLGLVGLVWIQFGLGVATLVLKVPLSFAILHQFVAMLMVIQTIVVIHKLSHMR